MVLISKINAAIAQGSMLTTSPQTVADVEELSPEDRDKIARMMGKRFARDLEALRQPEEATMLWVTGDHTVELLLGDDKAPWYCSCEDHQYQQLNRPCGHWLSVVVTEIARRRPVV